MLHDIKNINPKVFLQCMKIEDDVLKAMPIPEGDFTAVWNGGNTTWANMERTFITEINRQRVCPGFELYRVVGMAKLRYGHFQNPAIALRRREATVPEEDELDPVIVNDYPMALFDWMSSELGIEFSNEPNNDVYAANSNDEKRAEHAGDQVLTYWNEHSEKQHRQLLYQLVIFGPNARFLLYRRDGVISSAAFNYVEHPGLLSEFFWRFSLMDDNNRGWDTSVRLANEVQEELFETKVRAHIATLTDRKNLPNYEKTFGCCPTYKLAVPIEGGHHTILVRRAFFCASSMFKRGTRGFLVYDIDGDEVLFMKDAWRMVGDNAPMSEKEAYSTLAKHGVPFTPTVVYVGDVLADNGHLQITAPQKHGKGRIYWVHFRVLQRVAVPLAAALNSREFVTATHHAGLSMLAAHDRAGLLHRDISLNNIMIDPAIGCGILNDWDMCAPVTPAGQEPVGGRSRVGTCAFMSMGVVRKWGKQKIHTLRDDMQSLGWTMLIGALQYFLLVDEEVEVVISRILGTIKDSKTSELGKEFWLKNQRYIAAVDFESRPLLELCALFTKSYGARFEASEQVLPTYTEEQHEDGDLFDEFLLAPQDVLSFFEQVLDRDDWPKNDTLDGKFLTVKHDMTELQLSMESTEASVEDPLRVENADEGSNSEDAGDQASPSENL